MESNESMPLAADGMLTDIMTRPLGYFLTTIILLAVSYAVAGSKSGIKNYPLVNANPKGSLLGRLASRRAYVQDALSILAKGRTQYPNSPFRVEADFGELLVLPPSFADEIKNEPKLSLSAATSEDFHGDIPGFKGFDADKTGDKIFDSIAAKHLNKSLSELTEPLSEETSVAYAINFGDSSEPRDVFLMPAVLDTVARLSSRVFLGNRLCRNEDWLNITKSYTRTAFQGAQALRVYPRYLRKLVHWFLPECQNARKQLAEAQDIIAPVIEERRQARKAAAEAGQPAPEYNDLLDWADQEAARRRSPSYNPAMFQLMVSVAAIHTSTDLACKVIVDLAKNPEIIQPLRDEIVSVLGDGGWKKTSFYNMKLLDSCIKESQRVAPAGTLSMNRRVQETLKLSDGTSLKPGTRLKIDAYRPEDSSLHKNPEQWDGRRFLELRSQPGKENKAQLVSTSTDHLYFGHGSHACPGRFFAANEIKMIVCHLLMKYDWTLAPGTDGRVLSTGTNLMIRPDAKIRIQRRQTVELDINSL